mgnify:CR=1 FL=1
MTFVQNKKNGKPDYLEIQWRVGEYNRLSKEDGDKPESDSIQNQHSINQKHIQYLRDQGEQILSVTVYSDDGYAGGNFNRPRYQDLLRDIESGKINCIIFKDNSRLGRNYPELGRLMEDYFPQKGVRVISVLNNLDSVKDPRGYSSAIVSFANIVNDDYIRQLSIKIKCTLAMKRERGEFTGNYAPFGYQKDPNDRHKLVIDEEQAEIVRRIFDWYEEGMSASGIAKRLNAMQIMTPGDFKIRDGCKSFITHEKNSPKTRTWAVNTVKTILTNEVYIGNMVQGKHKSVSYRSKKMALTDESEGLTVVRNYKSCGWGRERCDRSWNYAEILWNGIQAKAVTAALEQLSYKEQWYLEKRNAICMTCGRVSPLSTQSTFEDLAVDFEGTTASGAERFYRRTLDKLRLKLLESGVIHTVTLKQTERRKKNKKIAAAVYLYQADNDGEWGDLRFDFESGTAEIVKLADWDTVKSNIFANTAIRFVQSLPETRLLKSTVVPFEMERLDLI